MRLVYVLNMSSSLNKDIIIIIIIIIFWHFFHNLNLVIFSGILVNG